MNPKQAAVAATLLALIILGIVYANRAAKLDPSLGIAPSSPQALPGDEQMPVP